MPRHGVTPPVRLCTSLSPFPVSGPNIPLCGDTGRVSTYWDPPPIPSRLPSIIPLIIPVAFVNPAAAAASSSAACCASRRLRREEDPPRLEPRLDECCRRPPPSLDPPMRDPSRDPPRSDIPAAPPLEPGMEPRLLGVRGGDLAPSPHIPASSMYRRVSSGNSVPYRRIDPSSAAPSSPPSSPRSSPPRLPTR